jgi:hypothetical protein
MCTKAIELYELELGTVNRQEMQMSDVIVGTC